MYSTRQRWSFSGVGENISRLMHHRKAARVLPVPVGARIKVDSPRAIAGHPRICGLVGAGKTASNHSRTAAWNRPGSKVAGESGELKLEESGIRSLCLRCRICGKL